MRRALLEGGAEQAQVALPRVAAQRLDGGRPDASPGCRYRADEGEVVIRIQEQAQVGDDVLDLGTFEETCPPEIR